MAKAAYRDMKKRPLSSIYSAGIAKDGRSNHEYLHSLILNGMKRREFQISYTTQGVFNPENSLIIL